MNDKNAKWTVFGDRLKSELERQGLTLTQISEKTGMPLPTLSRYAESQRIPIATQILRVAHALGVTCDYMLGLSDDPHKTRFGTELNRTEPAELIYKQAAENLFSNARKALKPEMYDEKEFFLRDLFLLNAQQLIHLLPSVQPGRMRGRWSGDFCSVCGISKYNFIKILHIDDGPFGTWNYCPKCGAQMEG